MPALAPAAESPDLSLPELGQPANQAMTPAEERRLGRELMNRLHRELPVLADPVINDYISDIGHRITSHMGAGPGFEFFAIQDSRINAFAMPGGYIGVHTGLLEATESESEFASVIAHEIAHVTERHIARQRLRAEGVDLKTTAMVLAGLLIATQDPQAGQAAVLGSAAAGVQSRLNYSRDLEREADRIGIESLARAGFRPGAMATFFERLQRANRYRGQPPPYLSTHPLTDERITRARERADAIERGERFESPSYPFVKARVRATRGDNTSQILAEFEDAMDSKGQTPARAYGRAMALIRAGRPAEAIEPLRRLIDEEGDYAVLYTTLAEAQLANDAPKQALTTLDEGLSLYPGDYALSYTRIEAFLASNAAGSALNAANELKRDFPRDVQVLDLRARAAEASGDAVTQALAIAELYAARGNLRGALRQLDRVRDDPQASTYQRSRVEALRKRWRQRLQQQQQGS